MFVAENREGQRYYSLFENESNLRELGKNHELVCPDCSSLVRFRAGTKTPHFYHKAQCTNPNPFSEPESPTHRTGKLALYNWLKMIYPGSIVELEYFIAETKQRSDVMLIHPDGKMLAFEFQCSKITGAIWRERHDLYVSADIFDIWILNADLLRFDLKTCKIISLEAEIFNQYKHISYLNPADESVTFIGDGYHDGTRIYSAERFQDILKNIRVVNDRLWLESYADYLAHKEELIRLEELKKKERQRILEINKKKQQEEEEFRKRVKAEKESQDSLRFNIIYTEIIKNRQCFMQDFTPKELRLFHTLTARYQLTIENFPGMFHLTVEHCDLIVTPPQLWQLWIFDQIMNKRKRSVFKKQKDPKIWLDDMKEKFIALRKDGYLRTIHRNDQRNNYIFTVYNYIAYLNKCGVLEKLGSLTTKYQRILVDQIPIYKSHKENAILKMYIEGYIHDTIMKLGKEFDEQIRHIQVACSKEPSSGDVNIFDSRSAPEKKHDYNPEKNIISLIDEFNLLKHEIASRADKDKCIGIIRNYYLYNKMDDESRESLRKTIQIHKTGE